MSSFSHYHAPVGFLNDPNGLVFHQGVWHLYHQHNPFDKVWGNMTWGHATSKDLMQFTFQGDVLRPDERGVIYSGCGLLNLRGCFGLPTDALLFFYTSAGGIDEKYGRDGVFTQRMAYSLDGGETLIKYEGFELPEMEKETRDPKVFWHEESGAYIMVLYLADARFLILRSEDLLHWERTQELDFPPMWECPDLVCLRDAESGVKKWAFLSADGYYFIGDFDGHTFTPETKLLSLYGSKLPYAAQTYSNVPGRVVQLSWLRTENRGEEWTGVMSAARELSLGKDADGWYIRQQFARELVGAVRDKNGETVISDALAEERISADGRTLTAVQLW